MGKKIKGERFSTVLGGHVAEEGGVGGQEDWPPATPPMAASAICADGHSPGKNFVLPLIGIAVQNELGNNGVQCKNQSS